MTIRRIEPTPIDGGQNSAPSAPSASPPTAPRRGIPPWERFGSISLDFLPIEVQGVRLEVTRVPAFSTVNGVQVYPPFSALDALEYGEKDGLSLPSASVLDAIRAASWWHAPITEGYSPSGDMQSDAVVIDHGRRWKNAFDNGGYNGTMPVVNVTKAWIVDSVALTKPGFGVNRGYWMSEGAKEPIQKRGQAHPAGYRDVAQGGVFVRSSREYLWALRKGALGDVSVDYEAFREATRAAPLAGILEDTQEAASEAGSALARYFTALGSFVGRLIGAGKKAATGDVLEVAAWNGNEWWTDSDIRKLVEICDRAGVNPADILIVHLGETGGGDPAKWVNRAGADNPKHPKGTILAVGMMQWFYTTAAALGYKPEAIAKMGITEQLDVLDAYLQKYVKGRGVNNAADMYSLNFQGGVCRTASCAAVKGKPAYDWNKAYDKDHDGDIDYADMQARVREYIKKWNAKPIRVVK